MEKRGLCAGKGILVEEGLASLLDALLLDRFAWGHYRTASEGDLT